MKKTIFIILAILMLATSFLPAADETTKPETDPAKDITLSAVTTYAMPLTPRAMAMGGAGIALPGRSDSFFLNPAGFAKRGQVSIPSVSVTIYHPYDLLKQDEDGTSIVDDIISGIESGDQNAYIDAGTAFLSTIKSGKGKLADVNAGVTFNFGGFALGLNVNDTLRTYGNGVGGLDAKLFDELNVTANVGLGLRLNITGGLWLDVGANFRPTYKAYTSAFGASEVLSLFSNSSDGGSSSDPMQFLMDEVPLAAGYALPFDVGLNLGSKYFSVGVVARNFNGNFKMKSFDSINDFTSNYTQSFTASDFSIKSDWQLDFGLGLQFDNAFLKPTIVADFVDIIGFADAGKIDMRTFMSHFKAGAELRILSFLDVRGGINQGYWSVGCGLDLVVLKVDLAYYWQEFGDNVGDYGLDAFTVRFNIGYDR